MNTVSERIIAAIKNTKDIIPGYFEETCRSRGAEAPCGSVILSNNGEPAFNVGHMLFGDYLQGWKEYPTCPNLMQGCSAFKLEMPTIGRLGIIKLELFLDHATVTLDDRKGTGKVSAVVKGYLGEIVDFVVCILGIEKGKEVVFTFHPGDPCTPSQVTATPGLHGKEITVKEAKLMGLETAKIV